MSLESEIKALRKQRIEEGTKTRKLTDTVSVDVDLAPFKEDTSGLFKAGTLDDGMMLPGFATSLGVLSTIGDVSASIVQGAGGLVEGITDLGAYGVAGILEGFGKYGAAYDVKKFAKQDTVGGLISDLRENSGIKDYSFLGDFGYDVGSGVGYITGLAAGGALAKAAGVTGKGLSVVSNIIMGLSGMGSGMSEAYSEGATDGEAAAYGAMSAGAEVLSEMMFGGLGSAFQKLGVGTGLIDLDDVITKKLTKNITNNAVKNLLQLGIKASGEGIEEVVSGFLSSLAKKTTYKSEEDYSKILADEELLKQAFSGFLVSLISQSGDVVKSTKQGREFITGLTDNEQKVVDKVYENRVTEAEKDGKLTSKEKNKIYEEVLEDLENGGIDIDLIEEVLGGDTYKSYKNTVDSEDALKKEYEELGKKTNPTLAEQTRYNELHEQMKDFENNSKRNELKSQLGNEVFNLAKDGKLAESYYERARRSEKFTTDVTKYKGKQAEVVQKAIDSGILNNTRRTHEFVDLVAKVSADKGVNFDFTSNEKLKNSGFAVDGKFVNGYVTKDGITVNINSKKALNSVVGHEITHVLEGTDLYTELENAIAEYAKSIDKDAYFKKFNEVEALYRDVEGADVYKELTADLVGDYLFTDADFVRSLSTKNRNLFEKLFDEIKYLCKLATAGSKEARQLEKVKKIFEDAYREGGKTVSDTKYSLSSMANTFFDDPNMSAYEFQQADYKQTQGYKEYVEKCLNNYRQTRADFDEAATRKEIEDSIDGIVRVAIAAKKAGYDIYDDALKRDKRDSKQRLLFSSLEPNSDYFTSNDISTICDKRKNFAEIYDEIVKQEEAKGVPQGKRFFDNVDNYFAIHKIMAEKGLTQPCRQCYVESMRKNLAPMANAFLKLVQETNPDNKANDQLYHAKGKQKGELKTSNASTRDFVLNALELHPEYNLTVDDLNVETLTTADGLAQLKIQAPLVYEAFNSFYGQSKPKMPKAATPFRFGELTALLTDDKGKIKQSLVDKINATGGFRLQSYSDFQIQNYTDVLQVLFEAGTLGLKGHAYTKVPAFLEATDGTNLKRNISIFMYKDGNEWKIDRNDSFPYSLEEIYDIVNADKSGNTSIIAVSQNAEMSAWIMANDNVGYGIPFHKSGMKMGTVRDTIVKEDGREIKGYSGIKDHTKQQTEVWAKTTADHKAETKVKKGINIYEFWDFENADGLSKNELIEKNVRRYIDECEIRGYLPKFREYVMNNDKVLNDTLRYAKELGFASPDATIDDISFIYKGYRIPYGYYKFLGDFGMFTPDGQVSPPKVLSLENYDFDKAVKFFEDAETLRRNEILQQFSNGEERQKYRDSNLSAEELDKIVKQKRGEVVDEVVNRKNSLSFEDEAPTRIRGGIYGEDVLLENAPKQTVVEDIAPINNNVIDTNVKTSKQSTKDAVKEIYTKNGWGDISKVVVDEDTGHAVDIGGLVDGVFEQWNIGEGIKGNAIFDLLDKKAVYEDGELTNEDELHSIIEEKLKEVAPVYNSSLPAFAYNQFEFYKNAIAEERAQTKNNRKPSISEVKRLASTKSNRKEAHGVLTSDGKQYWSNNAFFVVESNNPDTTVTENESLAVDRFKDILKKANDNVSETKYKIDPIDISLVRKKAPKGMSIVAVGDAMFDVRYVDAVLKAIENPEVQLTTINKTNDAILIKGSNGQAVVIGINPNANVRSANFVYKADEVTVPQTDIAPIAENVAPTSENIAPIKETVNEAPIAPIRNDAVTENAEIIPNGTKVKVSDRDNVGTVQSYNEATKEYTVFFRGKNGTATKTFPASMVTSLAKGYSVDEATSLTKSKIGTSEGVKKKPKSTLEWLRRNFVDKLGVFEDIALKTNNRALMDKAHTMLLSRQKAQYMIENGDADKGVKALADIREAVKKDGHYDDFVDYLLHKLNIDRMSIKSDAMNSVSHLEPKFGHLGKDQIVAIANTEITPKTTPKTAQTINEAKEYLSALNKKNKAVFDDTVTADVSKDVVKKYEQQYPQFTKFAEDVYNYNRNLLNMLVEGDILTQEAADLWMDRYPYYVPVVRTDYEGKPVVSLDKKGVGVNAPIKKAVGGNSEIQDVFKSIADRTEMTIKAIDKNRFGKELKKTINANVVENTNSTNDVDDILNSPDKILTPGLDGNSATFGIYENGKRVDFEITEDMYNALKPTSGDLARSIPVVSTLSKARRAILTSLSPMFAIKNPIRDIQDVFMNSKHAAQTYKNIPRAIKELAKNEGYAAEYAKNGGISGEAYDSETKAFKEAREGIMKYVGIPVDKLKFAGEFVETVPRLAEYIASRENGETIEGAMLDAARVTTNFVAGGDVTKFLNRNGFTFLNASVQGAAQQVRNVREAKQKGIKGVLTLGAKAVLAGLPLALANALIWDDDEEYEELPDYVKDNYYIVGKYGDQFVRIPKGRTLAVIQKAFDSMGDVITGNDEVDYDTFGELLWNNFVDTFQLGVSNLAPNNPLDNNIIAPIIQAHTNKAWYGDEIVPERLQDLPAGEQYDENIDLLSKWLGEKTNLSPYRLNYLLDQYTGAFGDFVLPMITPKAESDVGILAPFKNEFVVDSTIKNKNATNFFNKADELKVKANSAKATDSDILKSKYMDAVNAQLSDLYKKKRNVQNSTLSDKQKYAAVKELQQQINDLCEIGLESYKDVTIDGAYATVADMQFRYTDEGNWSRITDDQLEKQNAETARLGITPADYWRNYTLSNVVGENYKTYSKEIGSFTSDKNSNGDTIKDSRKKKVVAYINGLDLDYGEKLLIYKNEYPNDDSYNYEIINYLNSRDDLTTNDIRAILGRLGFEIDSEGNISWD